MSNEAVDYILFPPSSSVSSILIPIPCYRGLLSLWFVLFLFGHMSFLGTNVRRLVGVDDGMDLHVTDTSWMSNSVLSVFTVS